MELSDINREALIIRWRRLLILGIVDFFNGTNEYGKLIVKEILDMYEGSMKAFAETLHIPLLEEDGRWRRFSNIYRDIQNNPDLPADTKERLNQINEIVYSNEFNSLRKLRNNETHSLNLPDLPKETVLRVWRLFYDEIGIVDCDLFECAIDRHEFEGFYKFQDFFKKIVLDGNKVHFDLDKLKKKKESYQYLAVDRKSKTAEIELERDVWELIKSIPTMES
jgi:hypothetical protein